MNVAWAATLFVLTALVVLAAASFFRSLRTGVLLLVGTPTVLVLHALVGTLPTMFLVASLATLAALIHTITDTLGQVRAATRAPRRRTPPLAQPESRRQPDRSRIAA